MKMTNTKKIELVKKNHGGQKDATNGQLLMIANSLPPGTLENYEKKLKGEKPDANSKRP